MISLSNLRTYWTEMLTKQPALKSVYFITEEGDVKDFIRDITPEQQPFAIVLIPSAKSSGSTQNEFVDKNMHLFYILKKEDTFNKTTFELQEELQPITESIKEQLIMDKEECGIMRTLDEGSFQTDPERKKFTTCTGWSVSFNN